MKERSTTWSNELPILVIEHITTIFRNALFLFLLPKVCAVSVILMLTKDVSMPVLPKTRFYKTKTRDRSSILVSHVGNPRAANSTWSILSFQFQVSNNNFMASRFKHLSVMFLKEKQISEIFTAKTLFTRFSFTQVNPISKCRLQPTDTLTRYTKPVDKLNRMAMWSVMPTNSTSQNMNTKTDCTWLKTPFQI